jgi:rod shape determining protein RodA
VKELRIDYNLKDKLDLYVFIPVVSLILLGLISIYSATYANTLAQSNFEKQLYFVLAAILIFLIVHFLPTNTFKVISIPSYIFSILLLILVLIIGKKVSGSKSWIGFGIFSFQPSEFAKIATILMLSNFLSRNNTQINSFRDILFALAIGFTPVFLILLEPDMGSSLVYMFLILVLLFKKGISLFWLIVVISPAMTAISAIFGLTTFIVTLIFLLGVLFYLNKDLFLNSSVLALNLAAGFFADYVFNLLSPHQQARILSFLDPFSDPLGTGYNSIQSMVAVGSGGLFGKGFMNGNQTQLQYIPEQWTDFIFCTISEEFGFIGSTLVIILFLVLLIRILKNSSQTKDEFLSLTQVGIFSVLFIHFFINVGMVIGLVPIIGVPLPFVSYGGSSLITNVIMISIVTNIYRTRKNYA